MQNRENGATSRKKGQGLKEKKRMQIDGDASKRKKADGKEEWRWKNEKNEKMQKTRCDMPSLQKTEGRGRTITQR